MESNVDMENVKYIPGDLVKIYGDICRVKGVRKKDNSLTPCFVEARVIGDTEDTIRAVGDATDSIESIPLTPAILEANGWKISQVKDNEYYQHYPFINVKVAIKDKIALFFDAKNPTKFSFNNSPIHLDIQFVHQLQHLLFGLGLDSSLKV